MLTLEDDVDRELYSANGQIERGRDRVMCHHGANSKCAHCLPIDAYDEDYLRSRDVKHMSFHAYLRKLRSTQKGRSDRVKYPLENIVCHVKPGCTDHRPYPQAVCSKCRPSTVTLARQTFRHVDNVAFENAHIANRFCDYWRQSGQQRAAFLIGKYEVFTDVPLGIKATVACVYEPPQMSSEAGIEVNLDHEDITKAKELSELLGLRILGWAFTDLTPHPRSSGKVMCSRGAHSFFLSAQECITAGVLQNKFANPSTLSSDGTFGSRFVTVVVSGDSSEQVHFSGYQVSNQCAALVSDDLLVPVKKCPELAYIRDVKLRPDHYLCDVQYKEKDQYGNEVCRDGRPLPVEYLLVDVPSGVPTTEQYTFFVDSKLEPFPVANRQAIGRIQDEMKPLLDAVRNRDDAKVAEWLTSNEKWATFEHLMEAHKQESHPSWSMGNGELSAGGASTSGGAAGWTCVHCTFVNSDANRTDCEVCGLPQQ